ncbi:hypothetical protein [Pontibaca salina]|uniref:Uncharacterized protein n=1 Tax=Pontibaca salina TaxID=2795731 RepID=A0A934LZ58_9RHOB|nr:hypothetical protein [Pontibaca salina]MBI6628318.1 hypothetical protein [Pontibaca salina]
MKRRDFMKAAPAALAVSTLPAATLAHEEADPILPLYRQWVDARKEWYLYADLPGNGDWDMPESMAAQAKEDDAFWAMIEMTPTSTEGIAALSHVLWDLEGPSVVPEHKEYAERANEPHRKLMRAIWRAASGQNSLPPDCKMEQAFA